MSGDKRENYPKSNGRDRYSPTKRVLILEDSEVIRNNALVGSAQRIRSRSRSPIRRVRVLERTKMPNLTHRSPDYIGSPVLCGPLSPVRRSGSPERRQYISEIENGRGRKHTLNEDVHPNSTNLNFSRAKPENTKNISSKPADNNVGDVSEDFIRSINNFMDNMNTRLEKIESIQLQILDKLNDQNDK